MRAGRSQKSRRRVALSSRGPAPSPRDAGDGRGRAVGDRLYFQVSLMVVEPDAGVV
jgi:hypothetical protein